MSPAGLRALVLLSVLAAVVTIALKSLAYWLTRSVGLLSDALESGINLFAALTAYVSLHYSHRPADATHTYGHEKIEFFSSGLEGVLIVVAGHRHGLGGGRPARPPRAARRPRARHRPGPRRLGRQPGGRARAVRAGRRHQSIVLEADGRHLLTDVWTSRGRGRRAGRGLAERACTSSTRSSPSWSG